MLLGQEFYQRGGVLVRPVTGTIVNKDGKTEGWQLIQVTRPYLVETLCCAAQFTQVDGRGKTKAWKPIDAPDKVASALLSRRGKWRLPTLTASCRRHSYEPTARYVKPPATIRSASCCSRRMVRFH